MSMHTISLLAGLALGVPTGALAVLALSRVIRPRGELTDRRPPPVIVRLYIDENDVMRLGRHPAGAALTSSHQAEIEVDVRDTRPCATRRYVNADGDVVVDELIPGRRLTDEQIERIERDVDRVLADETNT